MAKEASFRPCWTSAPGETMADVLEERDLTLSQFAEQLGLTPEDASDLVHGRAGITIEIAQALEAVLGSSAAFWMNRESQYREDLARLERTARSAAVAGWLGELPVKDMIKFGWIKPRGSSAASKTAACLDFFGMPSVQAWRKTYRDVLETVAFRTSPSFASQSGAVAAWLRQGEVESGLIDCRPWDSKRFCAELRDVRRLTWRKNPQSFVAELQRRCAECGVAVIIARAPTGCRASGATRFLSSTKALLLLSARYLSDDHFWFTFFHEAGHLVLHDKKALFLEGENGPWTKEEEEANEFAARVLIPEEFRTAFADLRGEWREVIRFARRVGVSPGVVVGQLQYLGRIKRHRLNNLKRRYKWGD